MGHCVRSPRGGCKCLRQEYHLQTVREARLGVRVYWKQCYNVTVSKIEPVPGVKPRPPRDLRFVQQLACS